VARGPAALEAAAVGAGGAALGAVALWPLGLAPYGAAVGGANGALAGWRGIYDWRHASGWTGAVLDSTWGLVGVTGSLVVHALSALRGDPGYLPALSRRRGRHVYRRGWAPRPRFAFTAGNTITQARDVERPQRRRLIERHEALHIWQQRWFGPVFPLVYGAWLVGGAVTGTVSWLARRDGTWFTTVERHAYYANPFERWAYAVGDDWPPPAWLRPPGAPC
jgi:hypothetical protein